MDIVLVKREAVARVLARRVPPRYLTGPSGRRVQLDNGSREFEYPADAGEWIDDQLARVQGRSAGLEAAVVILTAARHGEAAAVAAVAIAGRLHGWDQWYCSEMLRRWLEAAAPFAFAAGLMRAVRAEWDAAGFQNGGFAQDVNGNRLDPPLQPGKTPASTFGPSADASPGQEFAPGVPERFKPPWARGAKASPA